jgi:hypothetical protein
MVLYPTFRRYDRPERVFLKDEQFRHRGTVCIVEHKKRGRPRKDAIGQKYYQISATLVPKDSVIAAERQCGLKSLLYKHSSFFLLLTFRCSD